MDNLTRLYKSTGITDDHLRFRRSVEMGVINTPPNNVDSNNNSDTDDKTPDNVVSYGQLKELSSMLGLSTRTASRRLLDGSKKRKGVRYNDSAMASVKKCKGRVHVTDDTKEAAHTWMENHPFIVQSPLSKLLHQGQ